MSTIKALTEIPVRMYRDDQIDDLVHQFTRYKDYSFIKDNGCDYDTYHKFTVTGEVGNGLLVGDIIQIERNLFKWITTSILLNYLCYRGIILPGEYIVLAIDVKNL